MSTGSPSTDPVTSTDQVASLPAGAFPWCGAAILFGATSIIVGGLWDISWHSSVGRDTFWTPAHMAIYVGGVAGGLAGGWAALRATFGSSPPHRAAAIRLWGARAPLGAWVAIWGALAMITSAPFDDWWHNAYGLDVEILSLPHTVLALGMFGIGLGGLLFLAGWQNRCREEDRARAGLLTACAGGVLVTMAATFLTEHSFPNRQHAATFYHASCLTYPLYLVVAARTAKVRWPATAAAAVYMSIVILMGWILPLFPAQPLLAPIYNHLDHFVPPSFPLLLVVPALLIDCLCRRGPESAGWWRPSGILLAVAAGAGFLLVFLPLQWFFSAFLLSPASDNRVFFGSQFFAYFSPRGDYMREYWRTTEDPVTLATLGTSFLLATLSAWAGLACGGWLSRVKR